MRSLIIGVMLVGLTHTAQAVVLNGYFSNGLSDWTTQGDISVTLMEAARLGDDDASGYSVLYQGVAMQAGTLEFDFNAALSSDVPQGTFPDLFAASLYFIDDLASFSLDPANPVFDDVIALFDLDAVGATIYAGSIDTGPPGASWPRFSLGFSGSHNYAIPTFELFEGNFRVDSQVLVDNVQITPTQVPEPTTALLVASGLLIAVRRRKLLEKNLY